MAIEVDCDCAPKKMPSLTVQSVTAGKCHFAALCCKPVQANLFLVYHEEALRLGRFRGGDRCEHL